MSYNAGRADGVETGSGADQPGAGRVRTALSMRKHGSGHGGAPASLVLPDGTVEDERCPAHLDVPAAHARHARHSVLRVLAVAGPGLVVMLADTDAGSIITAAQTGAYTGYALLGLQLALIPILYIVQELTVRLGLVSGRGHGELIRERFGAVWAWVAVSTLMVACLGALVTELSGIAGVGLMLGVPVWVSVTAVVALLTAVVWTGSYRSVERIALLFGAFELVFLIVAWRAHPSAAAVLASLQRAPLGDHHLLLLAAANIGAVIMPWMVFYQQSAVVDKGLTVKELRSARLDTAWGAILTQIIMASVLIASAATLGRHVGNAPLATVQQIAAALTAVLGPVTGEILFMLGMVGAALVAAIVVSLTAAWGLGEALGYPRSLSHRPSEAPWFYGVYLAALTLAGLLVNSGVNLVNLTIAVEVMNALLLPLVLGFLYLLARTALPAPYRLRGGYALVVGATLFLTSGVGVYAVLASLLPALPQPPHW